MNRDWLQVGQDILNERLKVKENHNRAKNVILFMGDGMGLSSLAATRMYKGQYRMGVSGEEQELVFEKFPHTGLSKVNTNMI